MQYLFIPYIHYYCYYYCYNSNSNNNLVTIQITMQHCHTCFKMIVYDSNVL